ncbi:MAG: hypothetical protein ACE5HI_20770 [bacterium]
MTRLAVRRRATPKRVRYSVKGKSAVVTRTVRKAAPKRKAKKRASKVVKAPIFVPRINSLLNNMHAFAKQRKQKYGAKDTVAKKLHTIHVAIGREMRKANIINPHMAKTLGQISGSLKGVPNVPQVLRISTPKLLRFIRDYVRKDVIKCIAKLKTMITPLQTEFKKLELYFQRELKKVKLNRIQYKVDPKIKSKFHTLNNNITKFKTKWYKRLNTLALYGNKNVQYAVKDLKKQVDDLQKSVRRNLTIINRYAKRVKPKAGHKTRHLFTAGQVRTFESKWNRFNIDLEKYRTQVEHFFDQLKAIKIWK